MATIIVGTNSYVTEAELATYASDRGITIAGTPAVLLISAMDYLDLQMYKGDRYADTQALDFPRTYYNYDTDESGEVPADVKKAQLVAAVLIDGGAILSPSIGRSIKREKVDVIEREYMDNSAVIETYPILNKLLAYYLVSGYGFAVGRA